MDIKNLSYIEKIDLMENRVEGALDVLANDRNYHIRYSIALKGRNKDLDILVNDKEYKVREQIALITENLKYLTILEQDENPLIKRIAANRKKSILELKEKPRKEVFEIIEENF